MAVIVKKVDSSSYRGLQFTKTWAIQEVDNTGATIPYNMVTKDIILRVLDRSDPPVILYEVNPTSKGNGVITFQLNGTQTDQDALVDYLLVEAPTTTPITVGYGTFNFQPIGNYIPFSEIVANEAPPGVIIPENFVTIKSIEWRYFLQNSIVPGIPDTDVTNDAAWPFLVNVLIAKLIVHDFLTRALKGMLGGTDGGLGSGAIKSITTGPSQTEWYDTMASIGDVLKVDKNGKTILSGLAWDICELASRLSIYLKLCGDSKVVITPIFSSGGCGCKKIRTHIIGRG